MDRSTIQYGGQKYDLKTDSNDKLGIDHDVDMVRLELDLRFRRRFSHLADLAGT